MNLIVFMTYTLDVSCQIHFNSVESINVRQGARFAPQQSGSFKEAKMFRPQNGSNIGLVQNARWVRRKFGTYPWPIFFLLVVTSSQHSPRPLAVCQTSNLHQTLLTQNYSSTALRSQQHLWYCLQNQQHIGISH